MADRIAVMQSGKLQAFDTPDDLYDRPKTQFIAGFVGNPPMNFLDVEIESAGGQHYACNHALRITLPADRGERAAAHTGRVVMGIRPEDITVHPEGEVRGKVFVVEPLGRDDLLDVELDGNTRLHVLADPQMKLHAGDAIGLRLNTDKIQFFDAQTQQSLLWA